jgi:hypothetical protein
MDFGESDGRFNRYFEFQKKVFDDASEESLSSICSVEAVRSLAKTGGWSSTQCISPGLFVPLVGVNRCRP